jgi:hypothetical protein
MNNELLKKASVKSSKKVKEDESNDLNELSGLNDSNNVLSDDASDTVIAENEYHIVDVRDNKFQTPKSSDRFGFEFSQEEIQKMKLRSLDRGYDEITITESFRGGRSYEEDELVQLKQKLKEFQELSNNIYNAI